jgi:DNA-binding NtrC family response regulator
MSPIRVLIVDDDAQVRALLVMLAELAGYAALTAHGADDALAVLAREPVDTLVTDVRLPGRDGMALAAEARARWPHLHLVVMSGVAHPESVQARAEVLGAAFLAKPFEPESFHFAIRPPVR